MGTGEFNAEGDHACDGLASHPGWSRNTPSSFMPQYPEISAGLMGHLARMQTLPYITHDEVIQLSVGNSMFHDLICYCTGDGQVKW